jgi:hypothetical protein
VCFEIVDYAVALCRRGKHVARDVELKELRRRFIAEQLRERDVDGDEPAAASRAIDADRRILHGRPEARLRLAQRLGGVC